MKALAVTLAILVPSMAMSQVKIDEVVGTVSQDSSITINGEEFGFKGNAAPFKWDDFQDGSVGDLIGDYPNLSGGSAWNNQWNSDNDGLYADSLAAFSDHYERVPGDITVIMRYGDRLAPPFVDYGSHPNLWTNALILDGLDVEDGEWLYTSAWILTTKHDTPATVLCRNMKLWQDGPYSGYWGISGSTVTARIDMYELGGDDGHLYQDNCNGDSSNEQDGQWSPDFIELGDLEWHRLEVEHRSVSSASASDGQLRAWWDGVLVSELDNLWVGTCDGGAAAEIDFMFTGWGYYDFSSGPDTAGVMTAYVSETYVDTTRARVEIGDANTFAACTHREVQIPTAWTDTSITVTVNAGTFSGVSKDAAFLYVYDKDGNVNSTGFPVTIGAGTPPSGITTPPTGLTIDDPNWNLLDESEDFEDAYWAGSNAANDITPGQDDPFGGTDAELWENTGTGWWAEVTSNSPGFQLNGKNYILSMYVKHLGTSGHSSGAELRLYSITSANIHHSKTVWSGNELVWVAELDVAATGIVDVGNGWYRQWINVDLDAYDEVGDYFQIQVFPWQGDTTIGTGDYYYGIQLERGFGPPGPYKQRP